MNVFDKFKNSKGNHLRAMEQKDLQLGWIKLLCIMLHDYYGFGKKRLFGIIGNWRCIYKKYCTNKTPEEMNKLIDERITEIFGEDGYPDVFAEDMKKL